MSTVKYKKPSGVILEINDNKYSHAQAEALGWERVKGKPQEAKPAKTTPPNVDSRGLPWDTRIHQKNKALDEDGRWKYKQGVDARSASGVETELLAKASSSA
jgi:hypothetical protein